MSKAAFVLSANIHCRHMTKGQRAMAVAIIIPEPEKGGRGKKSVKITEFGVSVQYISYARAVLNYSTELAEAVMLGGKPLQTALAETRQSQGAVRNERARLAKLRDERPDLADKVSVNPVPWLDAGEHGQHSSWRGDDRTSDRPRPAVP